MNNTITITFQDLLDEATTEGTAMHAAVSSMVGCDTRDSVEVATARQNILSAIAGRKGAFGRRWYASDITDELLTVGHDGTYIWANVARGVD